MPSHRAHSIVDQEAPYPAGSKVPCLRPYRSDVGVLTSGDKTPLVGDTGRDRGRSKAMPATVNCLVSTEGNTSRVLVETEGRLVAAADVVEDGAVVRLQFGVDRGHLPVQVRHTLVDAVFDLPALQTSRAVQAAIPLGDVDLLGGLRAHCLHIEARAAGST